MEFLSLETVVTAAAAPKTRNVSPGVLEALRQGVCADYRQAGALTGKSGSMAATAMVKKYSHIPGIDLLIMKDGIMNNGRPKIDKVTDKIMIDPMTGEPMEPKGHFKTLLQNELKTEGYRTVSLLAIIGKIEESLLECKLFVPAATTPAEAVSGLSEREIKLARIAELQLLLK